MMNQKVLDHIIQIEIKQRWKSIINQVELVTQKHVVKKTLFLSPGELRYAESVLCHYTDVQWVVEGGHDHAERRRLVIFPDYMHYGDIENVIAFLKISQNVRASDLTHRDYLGALLSLGIERDIIGDIIVGEGKAYLITTPEMKDYIKFNLNSVGSIKVSIEEADCLPDDVERNEVTVITGTVASLRIDSVISMALRLSRQTAQNLVASQKVKVNWIPVQKNMTLVKERDMVSVSGYGRFEMLSIGSLSRSNRWHIEVGKMK